MVFADILNINIYFSLQLNKPKSSMQRRQVQRQTKEHIKTRRPEPTSQIATRPRSIPTENQKQTTQNKQTITFSILSEFQE